MSDSDEEVRARRILRKYLDIRTTSITTPPRITLSTKKKMKKQSPQEIVDEFWSKFNSKTPGKASTLLPIDSYAKKISDSVPRGSVAGENASASYEDAVRICNLKVEKIVQECRRVNQKYRDPHFDIEFDLKWGKLDCLEMLAQPNRKKTIFKPGSVKRVGDIFEEPRFYIGPPSAKDIRQGQDGDCWLLAALCTLTNKPGLVERICVAKDEQVGVYGFVFYRDSEWRSEIIDDKLYLTRPDYDESVLERVLWEDRERVHSEDEYRKAYQTGSGALYFAQCENPNETWLPLLEKAYAKAHGDFAAIEGGFTGEGIEDLTGGVTVELFATDILDKEAFWKDELLHVNEEFLFGCATGVFKGWGERKGIKEGHAYSIMRAVEIDGHRLCLLKNPWGKGEWTGAWSDGSREWTPEWMVKLDHRFGNDGAFWINYEDLLRKYQTFDRTRLFDDSWKVTHQWATLRVPWTVDYHDTKFAFTIDKPASVVVVLNQLNTRYFKGLAGQYVYELCFRLHKSGEDDYILRSRENYCQRRSVSAEVDLEEPGEYVVLIKITAIRDYSSLPVEQVVRENAKNRRDKLLRIGLAYDLAHAKGQLEETPDDKAARQKAESRAMEKERKEYRQKLMEEKKKLKKKLKRQQKKENEKDKKAAAKEARRREKENKQTAGELQHTDCAECQQQEQERKEEEANENAKQAAKIVRPAEPGPARDQASPEHTGDGECRCEECKHQAKPSNIEGPEGEPIEHAGGKDMAENEMGTSEKTDGDHSSRNITFGDPHSHASLMPGIFPTSVRPSVVDVDVDGSNVSTAGSYTNAVGDSRRMSVSRMSSGGRSEGQRERSTSTIAPLTSSNVLDFVQPTYSPQVYAMDSRPRGVSVGQMEAPSPLVREVVQEEEDDSGSDVSSVCSSAVEEAIAKAHAPPSPPVQTEKEKKEEEKEEEDEFEKDPWNAVCVVGLRVYAKPLGCAQVEKEKRNVVADNMDKQSERERIEILAKVEEGFKQMEGKRAWTPTSEDEKELCEVCEDDLGSPREKVAAAKEEESGMVGVTIRVVRPKSWEDGEASLDVDDSAMDATRDHDKARKESVMGIRGSLGSVQV